jgi:polygalacturonase
MKWTVRHGGWCLAILLLLSGMKASAHAVFDVTTYGAVGDGTTNDLTAIKSAVAAIPTIGGELYFPPGIYIVDPVLASNIINLNKPIVIRGAGQEATVIVMKTAASNVHLFNTTSSLWVRDITLKVGPDPLTADTHQKAINFDLNGGGGISGSVLQVERTKITGFNSGIYADGGAVDGNGNHKILQAVVRDCYISISGVAIGDQGEPININRTDQLKIQGNIILSGPDRDPTHHVGDHAIYAIGNINMSIQGNEILGSPGDGIKAIAYSGQPLDNWIIENNRFTSVGIAIAVSPEDDTTLPQLVISNNRINDVSATSIEIGAVMIEPIDTATIETITMKGNSFYKLGRTAIMFAANSGSTIEDAFLTDNTVKYFSVGSGSTHYSAISDNGFGTKRHLFVRGLHVDGLDKFTTPMSPAAWGRAASNVAYFSNVSYQEVLEENCTVPLGTVNGYSSGTATLDFPSTGATASSDLTMTVKGASVGDVVALGTPAPPTNGFYTAWVSAADTVTIRYTAITAGNPASATFHAMVAKF